ncbi:hypothetical protein BJY01DRAFT_245096 [Aspergillus pseudoustus]|uniref:Extracellular membrane protein CFEM domain-containing protein n=1 Tax=Aspergillus pseudoustus TaxID=1810923 RepID=A0ABR4KH75_9EURO
MSSTTSTTTTVAPSASSTCQPKLYEIPTKDAACAMPNTNGTYLDLMTTCCGSAPVISYSNCDYYCLAQDQTVGNLAECLIKGSEAGQAWCNTNANATATGTVSASVVAASSATTADDTQVDPTETNGAVGAVDMKAAGMLAFLMLGSLAQLLISG